MNRIIEEFRKDDERILDRLVDGELTDEDRKQLLTALDDEPGAWRRCALAFLEAQIWQVDIRAIREESRPKESPVAAVSLPPRVEKPSRFFELCLALAACVVMAFGVGVWVRSMLTVPGVSAPGLDLAENDRRSPVAPPATVVDSSTPWHQATLNYDDPATQGADSLKLPVVESQNLTEDWLRQHRSALPADVNQALQDLERSGHRVIRRQQLVPIPLKDGKRLVVPVEQVDVEPGARPAY